MPNDQEQKKDSQKDGQNETAAKAELTQEIMTLLKDKSPIDLKRVYTALILLFERQKQ